MLCHAIIGKANGKEKIIKANVHADFISPVLELSRDRIDFRVDKRPDDVTALTPQTRAFTARNVSSLPLTCILNVEYPFQVSATLSYAVLFFFSTLSVLYFAQ